MSGAHRSLIRRELPILAWLARLVFLVMMSDKHLAAEWEGGSLGSGYFGIHHCQCSCCRGKLERVNRQFEEFEQEEIEQAKKGGLRVLV